MHILIHHWKGVLFGIAFGFAAALILRSIQAGLLIGVLASLRHSPALRAGEGKMIGLAVGGLIGLLHYISSFSPGASTPVPADIIQSSISPGDFTLVSTGLFVGFILGGIWERFFLSLSRGECFFG